MHRRIPWTELFSYITSEASSLTLSEVENIFAAWRLVLKKMYLSRRIICFSGIEVVWSTHTLKRPRRFFSVPVALPKTKMVRQISVIQNLIWYSTIVEHHGKMLILSLLSISWGCDVHSAFFFWTGLPSYYWPGRGEHEALGATNLLWTGCVEELCQWQPMCFLTYRTYHDLLKMA